MATASITEDGIRLHFYYTEFRIPINQYWSVLMFLMIKITWGQQVMTRDSAYHFPQYVWYWLEVFSAPRKEAGVSSNKIDEKHQMILFSNTRCLAGLEHRFQTPWNTLVFQCHLPDRAAISAALGSITVLSRRFI